MRTFKITVPIYRSIGGKTVMIGTNWYRNAHYHTSNKVKQAYNVDVTLQASKLNDIRLDKYKVHIHIFYKNSQSDLDNYMVILKFVNDALQASGIISNDTVMHCREILLTASPDNNNPRAELTYTEVGEE